MTEQHFEKKTNILAEGHRQWDSSSVGEQWAGSDFKGLSAPKTADAPTTVMKKTLRNVPENAHYETDLAVNSAPRTGPEPGQT